MLFPVISRGKFVLLVALTLALTGNLAFFRHVMEVYPWPSHPGFIVSLGILLVTLTFLLVELLGLVLPLRTVAAVLLLATAVTGYFSDRYGTVFNTDMIRNVMQTSSSEAADLLGAGLLVRMLLLGLLPALLVWTIPLRKSGRWHELRSSLQAMLLAVTAMAVAILPVSDTYASFIREHKMLRYYSNPATPLYSLGRFLDELTDQRQQNGFETVTASVSKAASGRDRRLVIVMVGETARADHFSLNGYARMTNPRLAAERHLVSYSSMSSCGTDTAVSVPCMFSFEGSDDFDVSQARQQENVLDVLARARVNVLWRDNNAGSKGVARRIPYEDFHHAGPNPACDVECRDVGMLSGLQEYIDSREGDILIVLHQMGSHGPAYFKHYPAAFEKFTPACHTQALSDCSREENINPYDNTILYTDYFLSRVIALLKANSQQSRTALFYLSDHGESLGENGIYLHGMPYLLATEGQTHVPAIAWFGPASAPDYRLALAQKDTPLTHDALAGSLLDAFAVKAEIFGTPVLSRRLLYMEKTGRQRGSRLTA